MDSRHDHSAQQPQCLLPIGQPLRQLLRLRIRRDARVDNGKDGVGLLSADRFRQNARRFDNLHHSAQVGVVVAELGHGHGGLGRVDSKDDESQEGHVADF